MIGKLVLGMTLATAVVLKDGLIEVKVDEHRKEGSHIHLILPATLATWGVQLAPKNRVREKLRREQEHLALAAVVLHELERAPDTVFVQVESTREHVRLETRSGNLRVDVDDPGETVHLSLPIRAARKVLEDLEAIAPAS
jgi:hypothetical protein